MLESVDTSRKAALVAREGVGNYGTDPGAGYTGVITKKGASVKTNADVIKRDVNRPHSSPMGHVVGHANYDLDIPLELKGGGVDGALQKPEADAFLGAAGRLVAAGAVLTVTGVTGTPVAGEQLDNTTAPGTVGTILHVEQVGTTATIYIYPLTTMPADTNALSGVTSGATATQAGAPFESWVYLPVSDRAQHDSLTYHDYQGDTRRIITGVRGDIVIDAKVSKIGELRFKGKGLWTPPTDQAIPDVTLSAVQPPVVHNMAFQLEGLDTSRVTVETANFKFGNKVERLNNAQAAEGVEEYRIRGEREASLSMDPSATLLSTWNPWTAFKAGAKARVAVTIGESYGNRCTLLAPAAQYSSVTEGERVGDLKYDIDAVATGSDSGDDEMYTIFW